MISGAPADHTALGELSAALKRRAVPAGLSSIRREASGNAYAEHGRTTMRLKPMKAAANRANQRAAREALRHARTGNNVEGAARRAGQRAVFTVKAGLRPHARATYEGQGLALRHRQLQLDAWRAACADWDHAYAMRDPAIARFWQQHNPRPAYPA